jgi:3-isopropylmalate dehydrogenase
MLLMIQYSFNDTATALRIENAVSAVLEQGLRTADIFAGSGRLCSTQQMGDAIAAELA